MSVAVTFTITMDEAKLDAYVRTLYDGPEHGDPVPNEPHPGIAMVRDWVEEARGTIGDERSAVIDTAWWDGEYVEAIDVALSEPVPA